jgi:predicted nucleic acid-binding protein
VFFHADNNSPPFFQRLFTQLPAVLLFHDSIMPSFLLYVNMYIAGSVNEFSNICIKKLFKKPEEIELAINEIIGQCNVLRLEKEDIKQALNIHKKFGYNYYDCLMIASALNSGCDYLLTEDLADGQIIENKLTIINIFSKENADKYLK